MFRGLATTAGGFDLESCDIEGLMGAEKITNTEMPATAVFLALRQSAYIVGQTINVDGGNIMS
jgi:NAD(P)-dependent dehydrogenase (short-subunit alcohol dehydrogenase family)